MNWSIVLTAVTPVPRTVSSLLQVDFQQTFAK